MTGDNYFEKLCTIKGFEEKRDEERRKRRAGSWGDVGTPTSGKSWGCPRLRARGGRAMPCAAAEAQGSRRRKPGQTEPVPPHQMGAALEGGSSPSPSNASSPGP